MSKDDDDSASNKSGFISIKESMKSIRCLAEKSIKLPSVKRIVVDEMREDAGLRYDLRGSEGSQKFVKMKRFSGMSSEMYI